MVPIVAKKGLENLIFIIKNQSAKTSVQTIEIHKYVYTID